MNEADKQKIIRLKIRENHLVDKFYNLRYTIEISEPDYFVNDPWLNKKHRNIKICMSEIKEIRKQIQELEEKLKGEDNG